jgi:hypothetical protein
MKKEFLVAVLLACALSATARADCPPGEGPYEFQGTWEWISTTHADGAVDTPASVGYSAQVSFEADCAFVRYRNEAPVETNLWFISYVYIEPFVFIVLNLGAGEQWGWGMDYSDPQHVRMVMNDFNLLPGGGRGPSTQWVAYVPRGEVAQERTSWGSVKSQYR